MTTEHQKKMLRHLDQMLNTVRESTASALKEANLTLAQNKAPGSTTGKITAPKQPICEASGGQGSTLG